MNAADLLNELTEAGIRLAVNGDRLRVMPPAAGCPDDLRARIVDNKPVLIKLVQLRDRLLALARSIGVPDRIVLELPATELQATLDQLPLWDTDELRNQVLMFYLRALAGIEPALPGSLAAARARNTTRDTEPPSLRTTE